MKNRELDTCDFSSHRIPTAPCESMMDERPCSPPPSYYDVCPPPFFRHPVDINHHLHPHPVHTDHHLHPHPVHTDHHLHPGYHQSVMNQEENVDGRLWSRDCSSLDETDGARRIREMMFSQRTLPSDEHDSVPFTKDQDHFDTRRRCVSEESSTSSASCSSSASSLSSSSFIRDRSSSDDKPCSLSQLEDSLIPCLNDQDFLRAFEDFEHSHKPFFWKKQTLQQNLFYVQKFCIWKYYFESTIESRHESTQEKPYTGSIDADKRHSNTSVWDLVVDCPDDCTPVNVKMPGSSRIKQCSKCSGNGSFSCLRCVGDGKIQCSLCWGGGHVTNIQSHRNHHSTRHQQSYETCTQCHGGGTIRCNRCYGSTKLPCRSCNETGKIEIYEQVSVKRNKKSNVHYSEIGFELPPSFLNRCEGINVFESKSSNGDIQPIPTNKLLHPDIAKCSNDFIKRHQRRRSTSRMVEQVLCIWTIPVYMVTCQQPSKVKTFCLAGTNHNIYSKKSSPKICNVM